MRYEQADDNAFNTFIESRKAKAAADEAAKEERKSFNFSQQEQVKFCASPVRGHAIVRFLGRFPEARSNPSDAVERNVAKVKDDEGKEMYLIYPTKEQDPEHLIWKIIDEVEKKTWVNKKPVYDVQEKHPEVWEIVKKGNYKPEDDKPGSKFTPYKWSAGWRGKETLFINCIDRLDDWCKENKHTKIFSKNVNVREYDDPDNPGQKIIREYADRGIGVNGFEDSLFDLVGKYKVSWERFDVWVNRTGEKSPAYRLQNATKRKQQNDREELEGITDDEWNRISVEDHLTAEEADYERYDLDKIFGVSSYNKILSRLGNQIKKIDAALGTHHYEELADLAKVETDNRERERELKAAYDAQEQDKKVAETLGTSVEEVKEATTTETEVSDDAVYGSSARRVVESTASGLTEEKKSYLKGWDKLSDNEKSKIVDVVVENGKLKDIIYTDDVKSSLMDCETDDGKGCGYKSPSSFTHCPVCGCRYA